MRNRPRISAYAKRHGSIDTAPIKILRSHISGIANSIDRIRQELKLHKIKYNFTLEDVILLHFWHKAQKQNKQLTHLEVKHELENHASIHQFVTTDFLNYSRINVNAKLCEQITELLQDIKGLLVHSVFNHLGSGDCTDILIARKGCNLTHSELTTFLLSACLAYVEKLDVSALGDYAKRFSNNTIKLAGIEPYLIAD